jgi:phospholipase A1/A2
VRLFKCTIFLVGLLFSLVVFSADKANTKPSCKKTRYYSSSKRRYVLGSKCYKSKFGMKVHHAFSTLRHKLDVIAPAKKSLLNRRYDQIKQMMLRSKGLSFYEPNYIMPYYYSFDKTDWYKNNPDHTPHNVPINNAEYKQQISFLYPLWLNIRDTGISLNMSYTQLMYWQIYTKSAFFRETNYTPSLFFSYHPVSNWLFSIGFRHQSNGRGGPPPEGMERSWGRVYADVAFSGEHWMVMLEPWFVVSDKTYNPDITRYLGYGKIYFVCQKHHQTVSIMLRNFLESGFSRGAIEVDYSFPLSKRLNGFVQVFSGYGQSLIEYNHRTTSVGVGIAFSNWV